MLERFLRFISGILSRLFGLKVVITPSTHAESPFLPATVGTPYAPTAITEPELGIASADPPRYQQWPSLLTYRERVLFRALVEDVGNQYQIFAKVRLGDIFKLANEPENRKFHSNQLHCKHFDFLLCDKDSYRPFLAIELDDSSHEKYGHRERDEFKERACMETGLKLWRLPLQQTYARGYVGGQVRNRI